MEKGTFDKQDEESSPSVSKDGDESSAWGPEDNTSRRRDRKKRREKHRKDDDRKQKSKNKKRKRSSRDESSMSGDDGSRSRSGDTDRESSRKKRKRDDDRSLSYSSSDYSDDSSEDRTSKKKKSKRHKESSRKRSKHKKRKHKSSSKDRSKQSSDKDDGAPYFGKYGFLKASDYHKYQRSFTVWLEEVKGIMSFNGPKWELQNYFAEYAEDFNTATLPHIKYYDYDKWEMEEYQKSKAASNASQKSSVQRDEALHMQSLQGKAKEKRQQEMELVRNMMSTEKRAEMKRKAELLAEMSHAYKTGDQETYLRLKSRLEPEK